MRTEETSIRGLHPAARPAPHNMAGPIARRCCTCPSPGGPRSSTDATQEVRTAPLAFPASLRVCFAARQLHSRLMQAIRLCCPRSCSHRASLGPHLQSRTGFAGNAQPRISRGKALPAVTRPASRRTGSCSPPHRDRGTAARSYQPGAITRRFGRRELSPGRP